MENWLLFSLVTLVFVLLIASLIFLLKQDLKGDKKSQENKVLLKQLLESFGLEVPAELEDPERQVVKSMKTP